MTATSMLPDRAPDRIRHGWRCTRQGPYRMDQRELDGHTVTITVCACGRSDINAVLADRTEKSS